MAKNKKKNNNSDNVNTIQRERERGRAFLNPANYKQLNNNNSTKGNNQIAVVYS